MYIYSLNILYPFLNIFKGFQIIASSAFSYQNVYIDTQNVCFMHSVFFADVV